MKMRYKIFGRHTGLRVSELSLGAANFGTRWGYGTEAKDARPIFDAYVSAGGNFIDTSDQYQFGQSEEIIGEFVGSERDHFVIATKFTGGDSPNAGVSFTGNSRKNMIRSLEASLKRLGTDRIDLYWVHFPDFVTPIDEIVRGLDDLVTAGKILYAGFSDFPAWRVSRAATLAEIRGWAPVAAVQLEYSLVERTPERELLPMAAALGLAVVTWSPLGGGLLTGKYRQGATGRATELKKVVHGEDSAQKTAVLDAVLQIAKELGCAPSHVAIGWVRSKNHITILGPRTLAQIEDNLGALSIELSAEHLGRLDAVSAVSLGFPHDFMAAPDMPQMVAGGQADRIDYPDFPIV
jgi:aryl-alcohol dehydrogenase-like predicted oxidoreductase